MILQKGGQFYDSDSSHKQNGKKIVSGSSGTSDSESSSSSSSSDSDTEIKPKAKKPVPKKMVPVPKPTPAPVRIQKPAETSDSDSSDEEEEVKPKPSKLNGTKPSEPAVAKPDPPRSNLDLLLDLDAPMEMSIPALTPVTGSATPLAPEKDVLDAKPMFVSTSSVELLNKLSTGGVQVCKFRRFFFKCPFH